MENKTENNIENINPSVQNVYNENNITPSNVSTNELEYNNNNNSSTDINENNTSNCLALTIKKDYKLTSKTNVILRSLRMTFKVFVSYVTLNIIKLFF